MTTLEEYQQDKKRGWKHITYLTPSRTSKAHFYVNGRSLCGRAMAFTMNECEDKMHDHSENCTSCMKHRNKLESKIS